MNILVPITNTDFYYQQFFQIILLEVGTQWLSLERSHIESFKMAV